MKFREWTITINGKGPINVVANEDTLLILQEYQHVEVALKLIMRRFKLNLSVIMKI